MSVDDVIKIFFEKTLPNLKMSINYPNFNIIFNKNDYQKLWKIKKQFSLDDDFFYYISIKRNNNIDLPTMYIKDIEKFFIYLTKIVERKKLESIFMYDEINNILESIWLRMGICDFNNVERFLEQQYKFLLGNNLDKYKTSSKRVQLDDRWDVIVEVYNNPHGFETNQSLSFTLLTDDNECHKLSNVHYEIKDNECYLYGIQNIKPTVNSKKVERVLYKYNKEYEKEGIHPNQFYTFVLFIKLLKKEGIDKIYISTLQVLNYNYHNLISNKIKKFDDINKYKNFVDKEDLISYLKTEKLLNLIYQYMEYDNKIQLLNDIDNQEGYLMLKIK